MILLFKFAARENSFSPEERQKRGVVTAVTVIHSHDKDIPLKKSVFSQKIRFQRESKTYLTYCPNVRVCVEVDSPHN